ncbi:MAG: N-acetylmuramoyl-L-alanine amidase, partial [Thermoanaerobaculia bacterium]
AVTSMVLAQTATSQAILRTPTGDRQVAYLVQADQTYISANDVVAGLGGTIAPDATGFRVTVNNVIAAFGPDSRYAVVRDDLVEMPTPPIVLEGKPYLPMQFFQSFLSKASDLDVMWDAASHVLTIRPAQHAIVAVQLSITDVQGISKMVATLSAPAEYAIAKEQGTYTIHFKNAIRAPFPEQAYDDPHIAKAAFRGNDLVLQLTSPDVVGDAYRLENPFRIVVDFRKAAGPVPGATLPLIAPHPVDLPGIRTIVIDPGHGGKEVGAIGPNGLMEKDATLAVARKLAAAIQSRLNTRVILTRDDDSVVSLDQRTGIANQYKADLFLSVHMNAAVVKGAHGSETYFLSLEASDELAKKAAEVENAASRSAVAATSDLKFILWDLAQQEYLNESSRFAQDVQEEMNKATGVQNRGVKQAPFKVLVGATMPAALVEVAFITNPDEESKLKNEEFQNMVVDALTRAIQRYKSEYEARIGMTVRPKPVVPGANTTAAKGTGT